MRYSQTFIDDLRRQTDIVRVIQDYVPLKKKGKDWMACCPFHKEKTPSFSVVPGKEIFYCFGCHKGGSVFNFVMDIENVPFPEAIKIVAEKSGVPLPKLEDDDRFAAKKHEADEVIELNRWALEWWEQQLDQVAEARLAREYLSQREITEESRKTFRLGYAPDRWDALSSYLRRKGATQLQIDRSGLVVKKEEGGSYDRFRGRLIFPVMDIQSRPIAFGARTLKNEDAKYLNSPETAAYVKGRNLYGLNLARAEIRQQGYAILVEGYLDLIVPYQLGVRNIVASLGTALTPYQAKLLSRFAPKVVVNYDGDRAGVNAAKRAIETLIAEDLEVSVLVLPGNADPDEFIRKEGALEYQRTRGDGQQDYSRSAWERSVSNIRERHRHATGETRQVNNNANDQQDVIEEYQRQGGEVQPHIQFVIDQAVRDRNLRSPTEKASAVEEVLPYVRAVRSPIQKREYFDIAMDALRIEDAALKRELWHSVRADGNVGDLKQKVLRRGEVKPTVAEQRLLELLFADEQLRQSILPRLSADDYEGLPTAGIFQALKELENEGAGLDFGTVSAKIEDDPVAAELVPMLLMSDSVMEGPDGNARLVAAERCIDTLRLMKVDRRIDELKTELAAAERNGEIGRLDQLVTEQIELTRLRGTLRPQADAGSYGH